MKKLYLLAAGLVVTASVAAVARPSFAHDDNDNHNKNKWTVTLKQVDLQPTTVPTVIGQTYALTEDAFDQGGKKIGHDGVACTATRITTTASEFLCNGALSIDGRGQVQVQGLYTKGQTDFNASIVGGDGDFSGARGQVSIHVVSSTERQLSFRMND